MMLLLCILLATSSLAYSFEDAGNRTKRGDEDYEMFEGDILLPKEHIEAIKNGGDPANLVGARGLLKYKEFLWPGGVVYYTIDTRRPLKKAFIYSAMSEYEEKTCLRFKPRTTQKNYIEFFVSEWGKCYSRGVCMVSGKQQLSLGWGCIGHGIAVHEIGHAIGLYHEQSRPDRNDYVEIIWDNIDEENYSQFGKRTSLIDSLGVPYDYGSIMHYGKHELSK